MEWSDIEEVIKDIEKSLANSRLEQALQSMENLLFTDTNWELSDQLERIRTSYHFMLNYLMQGVADPQRNQLREQLLTDAWRVCDRLSFFLRKKHSNSKFVTTCHKPHREGSLSDLIGQLEAFQDNLTVMHLTDNRPESINKEMAAHEEYQVQLFDRVWTTTEWSQEDLDTAVNALHSETLMLPDLCLLISAATMSLLEYFDERKISFILDASRHSEDAVRVRALTCLSFTLYKYQKRIPHYPKLTSQLELMKDDLSFHKGFGQIYLLMLQAQDTQTILKKIREEIMPEVIKNIKELNHGLEEANEENDYNPDWGSLSPELDEQLQKMNELIMEGSDVYLSTFSMMKHHAFFKTISNWFLPYYAQQSLVFKASEGVLEKSDTIDVIMRATGICDSDKYSMISIFPSIPNEQKKMILGKFDSEETKKMIMESLKMYEEENTRFKLAARNYIQCLYRFFKLYPWHHEFTDVFQQPIHYPSVPYLQEFLQTEQQIRPAAEYLFKAQRWEEATNLYEMIDSMHLANASDYQKLGYCYQKDGDYRIAVEYYEKADELQPNNSWTLRHLATSYRLIGIYSKALQYYIQAGKLLPNNQKIIYQTGICLLELGRQEEALQKFFQLEMMEGNNIKVWRAIGWCSFLLDKYDQSINYFSKALAKSPSLHDYLNIGHNYLVTGDLPKAVNHYKEALKILQKEENAFQAFVSQFSSDKEELMSKGVSKELITFVYDLVLID